MYSVSISKEFICQHFLIGGDWGSENQNHSHHFKVVIGLRGDTLDRHGYLYDISILQEQMQVVTSYFADKTLNQLKEFEGLNPSVEHFSRIFLNRFKEGLELSHLCSICCELWEDRDAWASYSEEIS